MSVPKDLLTRALELERQDREELVHHLLSSLDLDTPLSHEEWLNSWGAEIEERIRRFESGETQAIPADEVIAQLRSSLKQGQVR